MKKTVLITGSSRGIGAACAQHLASKNYKVAVTYFKHKEQANLVVSNIKKAGGEAKAFYVNVGDSFDIDKLFLKIEQTLGPPLILINNAAIALQKLITQTQLEEWNSILNVNVTSVFLSCKRALSYMINQKWGRIVNISSIWGIVGGSCEVAYSASKAAVIGFSKALAKEIAPCNITVNCVAPGVIKTDMLNELNEDTINLLQNEILCGRLGESLDIVKAIEFFISDEASYITGQVLNVSGGFII